MNVQVPKELEDYVQEKLASGECRSEAEIMDRALKLLQDYDRCKAELDAELQKGLDSLDRGEGVSAEEVFDRLEAKYRRLAERR